ncbi:MAG: DUF3467 domain-containing protein [Bacteroidales bacterium]|nr:DUF3467 domain-containing protein [Bacteroidales bacterium]
MANNENNQQQIQIEVPNEEMQGRYANLAVITHGPNDFFIDMILLAPNTPKARVQSRVIMTPENAKQLMFALQQNVAQYEATFGEIKQHVPVNAQQNQDGIIDFPLPKGQA